MSSSLIFNKKHGGVQERARQIQLLRSRLGEGDISQRLSLMLHGGRQVMEVDVAV